MRVKCENQRLPERNQTELLGFPSVREAKKADVALHKKSKKSGGFQAMGLSYPVIQGVVKRGYKVPTPIQRKTIPIILEGRDVVAMAKTGSGKTACFLIPIFERLKQRNAAKGARALILSPTRELAIQTFKFIRELGKFLDLKTILVLGGDSMDSQFSAIHTCPDIIVATPGRFLHLCVEMDLKLSSIEYVAFDEADRLFDMGFGEQLNEMLTRLPASRQTVLFSATLPKLLVDFAKAGLSDPVLIRLDVDSKIPESLKLKFIYCRPVERYSALVALMKHVIPQESQTVVFVATQHHVDLLSYVLTENGITNTSIYSSMDPSARKINSAKFAQKKVSTLIVTDIAARGIDIPSLDYVINVHFPGKPKLFIHRVGRCARADRQGTAYSIFSTDDEAHLLDLYLFLSRPLNILDSDCIGVVPQEILEDEHHAVDSQLKRLHIANILKTSENAYKKYMSSRPVASVESNKRVKHLNMGILKPLVDFAKVKENNARKNSKDQCYEKIEGLEKQKENILEQMRQYRPSGTIFELNPQKKSASFEIMKNKRVQHLDIIEKFRNNNSNFDVKETFMRNNEDMQLQEVTKANEEEIALAFENTIAYKSNLPKRTRNIRGQECSRDLENFIPYQPADKHAEDAFAINNFDTQAQKAEFSINDNQGRKFKQGMKKWDRIKKKMVAVEDPRSGKIRTESGLWIPATYKTGRYKEWKQKSKIETQYSLDSNVDKAPLSHEQRYPIGRHKRHEAKLNAKKRMGVDPEIKNSEQIAKKRLRIEMAKSRERENKLKKDENRKKHAKNNKRKGKK